MISHSRSAESVRAQESNRDMPVQEVDEDLAALQKRQYRLCVAEQKRADALSAQPIVTVACAIRRADYPRASSHDAEAARMHPAFCMSPPVCCSGRLGCDVAGEELPRGCSA